MGVLRARGVLSEAGLKEANKLFNSLGFDEMSSLKTTVTLRKGPGR